MTVGHLGIAVWALLGFGIIGAGIRTASLKERRLEAAPSCYIGHLATMESKPLPSGQIALHFSGWMEGGEKRITQFERSVPVWPAQEPHVLMCVQFSPSDSAHDAVESF